MVASLRTTATTIVAGALCTAVAAADGAGGFADVVLSTNVTAVQRNLQRPQSHCFDDGECVTFFGDSRNSILRSLSTDFGRSWGEAEAVTSASRNRDPPAFGAACANVGSGKFCGVVFRERSAETQNENEIKLAVSADGGATFGAPTTLFRDFIEESTVDDEDEYGGPSYSYNGNPGFGQDKAYVFGKATLDCYAGPNDEFECLVAAVATDRDLFLKRVDASGDSVLATPNVTVFYDRDRRTGEIFFPQVSCRADGEGDCLVSFSLEADNDQRDTVYTTRLSPRATAAEARGVPAPSPESVSKAYRFQCQGDYEFEYFEPSFSCSNNATCAGVFTFGCNSGDYAIAYTYSTDGGETFEQHQKLARSFEVSFATPSVTCLPAGDCLAVYHLAEAVGTSKVPYMRLSTDGGMTFDSPDADIEGSPAGFPFNVPAQNGEGADTVYEAVTLACTPAQCLASFLVKGLLPSAELKTYLSVVGHSFLALEGARAKSPQLNKAGADGPSAAAIAGIAGAVGAVGVLGAVVVVRRRRAGQEIATVPEL